MNGFLAIGDVHGESKALDRAIRFAHSRNLRPILLGDLVDYGEDPAGVIKLAYVLASKQTLMLQ